MNEYMDRIIVYRKSVNGGLLKEMGDIFREFKLGGYDCEKLVGRIYAQINALLDIATDYGFDNNLWKSYIAYILAMSENPFTITCEKQGAQDGTVNEFVKDDLVCFHKMLNYDFTDIENALSIDCFSRITHYHSLVKDERRFNKSVSDSVKLLAGRLVQSKGADDLYNIVTDFYRERGVGKFGLNKAFRIIKDAGEALLVPITNTSDVKMSDIIGYENQKKKLIENTESFVRGG